MTKSQVLEKLEYEIGMLQDMIDFIKDSDVPEWKDRLEFFKEIKRLLAAS